MTVNDAGYKTFFGTGIRLMVQTSEKTLQRTLFHVNLLLFINIVLVAFT